MEPFGWALIQKLRETYKDIFFNKARTAVRQFDVCHAVLCREFSEESDDRYVMAHNTVSKFQ